MLPLLTVMKSVTSARIPGLSGQCSSNCATSLFIGIKRSIFCKSSDFFTDRLDLRFEFVRNFFKRGAYGGSRLRTPCKTDCKNR